jgi:hypothetical protein
VYTYHILSCEFCPRAWKKVYSIHRYMIQFGNDLWWVGVYHHQWYFLTRYRWNIIWGKRPPNNENMFSIKNAIISMMSVSKNILFESVFFLAKSVSFLNKIFIWNKVEFIILLYIEEYLYKGHVLFVLMTIPPPKWLTTRVARRVTAVEHGLHTFSLHLSHCNLVPCCRVRHHFRVKQCSVRLCSNWFCKDSMVYLCYLCLHTYTSVKHDLHIRWCSCRLTVRRRVTLVEQRLPILLEHMSSPPVFLFFLKGSWISNFSFLCIVFHIIVCLFVVVFLCLCIVCPPLVCDLLLSFWYRQAVLFSCRNNNILFHEGKKCVLQHLQLLRVWYVYHFVLIKGIMSWSSPSVYDYRLPMSTTSHSYLHKWNNA